MLSGGILRLFQNLLETLQSLRRWARVSGAKLQRGHSIGIGNPLWWSMALVAILLCEINQMKYWILGFALAVQFQEEDKWCRELDLLAARLYSDWRVNFPSLEKFQTIVSAFIHISLYYDTYIEDSTVFAMIMFNVKTQNDNQLITRTWSENLLGE